MEEVGYTIWLLPSEVLEAHIGYLFHRLEREAPASHLVRYHDLLYQAKSSDRPRWVVAEVECHIRFGCR